MGINYNMMCKEVNEHVKNNHCFMLKSVPRTWGDHDISYSIHPLSMSYERLKSMFEGSSYNFTIHGCVMSEWDFPNAKDMTMESMIMHACMTYGIQIDFMFEYQSNDSNSRMNVTDLRTNKRIIHEYLSSEDLKTIPGIIFLDFDGVMSSIEDGTSYKCGAANYGVSKKCASNLRKLIDETGAAVIISSNWRRYKNGEGWTYNDEKFLKPLDKLVSFRKDIFGEIDLGVGSKSVLIERWIKDNNYKGKYVIFDDCGSYEGLSNHEVLSNHFIETDDRFGLTIEDCERAKKILA